MKKFVVAMVILIVIGVIIAGIGGAIFVSTYGSGGAIGKEINYTEHVFDSEQAFTSVSFNLRYAHKISFVRGEKYSVKYSDSEDFPTTVSAQNGTLSISERDNWIWWQSFIFKHLATTDIVITVPDDVVLSLGGTLSGTSEVTLPSWEFGTVNLKISGATALKGYGVKTGNLDFDISGASKIELGGEMGSVKVELSGATKLDLSGTAPSLSISASGSADVDCKSFTCPSVTVSASGSVEIDLEGEGDVLEVKSSGSAEIDAKDFPLKRASFDGSGSMKAEISVSEYLYVKSSGSATIKYWGDPTVNRDTSGSSTVKKMG